MTAFSIVGASILFVVICLVAIRWLLGTLGGGARPKSLTVFDADSTVATVGRSPLINVTFEQALRSQALYQEMRTYALKPAELAFGLDAPTAVLQSLALRPGKLIFQFSPRGEELIKAGLAQVPKDQATGNLLGLLKGSDDGRFIELAKGGRAIVPTAAAAMALMVACAHIVAGMDMALKLEKIDRKIDELLRGRRTDQYAQLEAVYVKAGETLKGTLDNSKLADLRKFSKELYQLRATWRREISGYLESAPTLGDWKVTKPGTWRRHSREQKLVSHLAPCIERIKLTRIALATDLYLAFPLGSITDFTSHTVPNEHEMWEKVTQKVSLVAGKLRESDTLERISLFEEGMKSYSGVLGALSSRELPVEGEEPDYRAR
jgi:hypothetical protein